MGAKLSFSIVADCRAPAPIPSPPSPAAEQKKLTKAEIDALGQEVERLRDALVWERASADFSRNATYRDISAEQIELDRMEVLYRQQKNEYDSQPLHSRLGRAIKRRFCCGT